MAKEFVTGTISEVDIDQVIITRTKDEAGAVQIRLRANVIASLINKLDAGDTYAINIPINATPADLGVAAQVLAIRGAILAYAKTKL